MPVAQHHMEAGIPLSAAERSDTTVRQKSKTYSSVVMLVCSSWRGFPSPNPKVKFASSPQNGQEAGAPCRSLTGPGTHEKESIDARNTTRGANLVLEDLKPRPWHVVVKMGSDESLTIWCTTPRMTRSR